MLALKMLTYVCKKTLMGDFVVMFDFAILTYVKYAAVAQSAQA